MSGEAGWHVDPATRGVLMHVESLGYVVVVFRLPSSLHGTVGPSLEMHAVRPGVEPPELHVVRIVDADQDRDVYRCACELSRMVGVTAD